MTITLRVLLGTLVVAAPWICGAVSAQSHFYISCGLIGIALLRGMQNRFFPDGPRSTGIPVLLIVLMGFLVIGVWQVSQPAGSHPLFSIQSAPWSDLTPKFAAAPELTGFSSGCHTLSPEATQHLLAQLTMVLLAFWLGYELYETATGRRWLYLALAVNGLAITGLGIAQQLTWNGQLFWTIPLRYGGSPFGPFVNRNNGAGYLLLTFACAVSSFVSTWYPCGLGVQLTPAGPWHKRSSPSLVAFLAQLTPGVLLSGFTVVVIAVGILASLSRAGAAGLLAAVLILIPTLSRGKTRVLVCAVGAFGLVVSSLIWLGQYERIGQRLASLSSFPEAFEGRVEHWREVASLVRDHPWTGSGWGTYALVNPVYLSRNHDAWFQHAENQYLEILAEAGLGGLILFIAGWLLLAHAAASSMREDQAGRQLASGICGLLAVAALSVVSITDFSLSIGSISLTFAVLGGTVYASCSKLPQVSSWVLIARDRPRWRTRISTGLLVASGLAVVQLHQVAEVEACLDSIPPDSSTPPLKVSECDEILTQLHCLNARYPKQSEIYAALGQLRITRFRRMLFDDLSQTQSMAKGAGDRQLWGSTHLERLDAVCAGLRSMGDTESEEQLLKRREIADNLPAALAALDRSVQLNPLLRGVAMPRAWLSHILQRPSTPLARDLAMSVGTSDAEVLFQAGQLSQRLGHAEEATRCWQRCLELSDDWSVWVWNEATLTRDESDTLTLYPNRFEPLMRIAAAPRSMAVRREILERCRNIASTDTKLPTRSLARLHMQLNDLSHAADAYLQAIRESPYDVGLRLEATETLELAGRYEQACSVIGVARNLAPHRSDVTAKFELLIQHQQGVEEDQGLPSSK